jgi:serine phosphatase RsbU (regulator of sigma subunit)
MAKTFKGKPMKLGMGGKFAKGVADMTGKGMPAAEAQAIMAKNGIAKYGQKKMTSMAAVGKKRAAKKGK